MNAREWLIQGGGGHEGGEDGIRALTVTGEGLVEFLKAYGDDARNEALEKLEEVHAREIAQARLETYDWLARTDHTWEEVQAYREKLLADVEG